MPLGTQATLLQVLEERTVTRLGLSRARPIAVRVVAASNRDLETASQGRAPSARAVLPPRQLHTEIKSLERARIVEALAHCGGNQSQAAVLLGMPRRTLVTRLEELALPRPRKRS